LFEISINHGHLFTYQLVGERNFLMCAVYWSKYFLAEEFFNEGADKHLQEKTRVRKHEVWEMKKPFFISAGLA